MKDYKISSTKIAPFKKHTPPYTGPSKPSLKKSIDIEELFLSNWQKHIRFMMDCLSPKYVINDGHYFNQMIRGEIYFLIEYLMSSSRTYEADLMKNINEFFECFISFTIKFLEYITIYLKEVYSFIHYFHKLKFF